ncbi:MAG: helix-turn-helix domain-containing protein [Prochloraceae cyanobacterium]
METKQRKERFIVLLNKLLNEVGGVKAKLAQKLGINSSTLTRWFQGKTDPATLELVNFIRLSEVAELSADELAKLIGILPESEQKILDRFKNLVEELLSNQSLEQLGNKLGVTYSAISRWISSQKKTNPENIAISTIAALAVEKGWTIEKLLIYLALKQPQSPQNDLFFQVQSSTNFLSLNDQLKLLGWLSDLIQEKITQEKTLKKIAQNQSLDRTLIIILEQEDLAIGNVDLNFAQRATSYSSNLVHHLQLQPDNIQVTTITQLPQSLDHIDILIFDISTGDSPSIAIIKEISFDGDIVVFVSEDLSGNLRAGLGDKVSDVLVKPIDWSSLKDKEYFR